ncbi:MAG: PAS domain-containing protein [Spirochaetes bacterium]|nr:PAS domain-containing protein [Spirochaetota bacterium]
METPSAIERVQREGYRIFFHAHGHGMYLTSREGRFLEVNASLCRILGYSREDFAALHVNETYAFPLARRRFQAAVERHGRVERYPVRLRRKDGSHVQAFLDAFVWTLEDGKPGGYMGHVVERVEALDEEHAGALKSGASPFSHAVGAANDGLWQWMLPEKRIAYSARWKEILGYRETEVEDRVEEWFSRIHRDDFPSVRKGLSSYLLGEVPVLHLVFRMRHRDGKDRHVLLRGRGQFDAKGRPWLLAGSLTNLTHQFQVIEGLRRKEKDLSAESEKLAAENRLLSQYFSADQVDSLRRKSAGEEGDGVETLTVLSAELAGAVAIMERLGPGPFAACYNEILTDLVDILYGAGGSVLEMHGDGILAVFGSPELGRRGAQAAVACARQLQRAMATYNEVRPEALEDPVRLAIGVATGKVFLGSLGSVRRKEYTALGEPVLRARRLRVEARDLPDPVLIDTPTREALDLKEAVYRVEESSPRLESTESARWAVSSELEVGG